jgi:hypothetical protein
VIRHHCSIPLLAQFYFYFSCLVFLLYVASIRAKDHILVPSLREDLQILEIMNLYENLFIEISSSSLWNISLLFL